MSSLILISLLSGCCGAGRRVAMNVPAPRVPASSGAGERRRPDVRVLFGLLIGWASLLVAPAQADGPPEASVRLAEELVELPPNGQWIDGPRESVSRRDDRLPSWHRVYTVRLCPGCAWIRHVQGHLPLSFWGSELSLGELHSETVDAACAPLGSQGAAPPLVLHGVEQPRGVVLMISSKGDEVERQEFVCARWDDAWVTVRIRPGPVPRRPDRAPDEQGRQP